MALEWLIDLMKEWVQAQGYLTTSYIERGTYGGVPDFDAGDLTLDGTWQQLDLSAIVPAGAKAVNLYTRVVNDSVGFLTAWKAKNHDVPDQTYTCYLRPQVAGLWVGSMVPIGLGSDRILDYIFGGPDNPDCKIVVKGWWL